MSRKSTAESDMQVEAVEAFTDDQLPQRSNAHMLSTSSSQQSLKSPISHYASTGRMIPKNSMSKASTESMQVELMQKVIVDQRAKNDQEMAEDKKLHAGQIAEKQGQIAKLEAELRQHVSEMERLAKTFDEEIGRAHV